MSSDWTFLTALNDQLRRLRNPTEIQQVAVRLIGAHLQASGVIYAHIDGDEFVVERAFTSSGSQASTLFAARNRLAIFGGAIVDTLRRGLTVAVSDVHADERLTPAERTQILAAGTSAFIGVPVVKERDWLALFSVHSDAPRAWTRDQTALAVVTADRAWAAAERARAELALKGTEDRHSFLQRLGNALRQLRDPARVVEDTCQLLGKYLHANRVVFGEIDGDYKTIAHDYVDGLPSQAGRFRWTELGESRLKEILTGRTIFAKDTSAEIHTPEEREALRAAGIGAYVSATLLKQGRLVGSFAVHSREARVWTPEEIALVEDTGERLWTSLQHLKTEAALRANKEHAEFLLRLNDAIRPLSGEGEVQETAARLLGEHLQTARVAFVEGSGTDFVVRREYARGVPPHAGRHSTITPDGGLDHAVQRGGPVVIDDVAAAAWLTEEERTALLSAQNAAIVWVPLRRGEAVVAGFGAGDIVARAWTPPEVDVIRDVAERTWEAVERSRADSALRDQTQRLRLALEASSGGSWTWDASTNQANWDERFRELYRFARDEPPTTDSWLRRVHDDDRARVKALVEEILTSKRKDSWECTFRIVRPDESVCWIQSRGHVDRDADGNVTRLTGLDLDFSHHRRSEEAQQARREEEHSRDLRALLETATQGIVSLDVHGAIVTANHAFAAMFGWGIAGWAHGDLVGLQVEHLMPFAFRDGYERRGMVLDIGQRKDGTRFPIELSVNHVATREGARTFVFVTDITERQRAAAALQEHATELEERTNQLRRLASDLTLTEQRAREQIAKTLHDGLQQLLVIAALNIEQQIKQDSDGKTTPSVPLVEARRHLEQAIASARSLSVEIFPPVLHGSGLPEALTWLADWMREKYRLTVHVIADPRADTERKDVRTLLFESVRELLFNAAKHAQSDRVVLELALDAHGQLCLTVTDAGVGFDPAELDRRTNIAQVGWGLFSIRERLTLLGGRFEIDSAPGKGTRVRIVAPPAGAATSGTVTSGVRRSVG